ncbi:DUF4399 domain-containing protein [Pseudomonas taetrolens]|uniref:DUF4399 domain-containing protein n=1 Tax=Pseudomonas taetrolens TaxID=47884 RepID=UPI003F9569FC
MNALLSRVALASVLMGASVMATAAGLESVEAPAGAKVTILSPADGATVDKTFTVKFGIEGMDLKPAGDPTPYTGHHHLLIDVDTLPAENAPIPADANHVHFGKAQTETEVTLTPGKHTLQLELGDKYHVPFKPAVVSEKITVNVK